MKRYILTFLSFLLTLHLMAQAPEAFQYQAVLRDSDGNIRSNESLELGITILQTSASGTEVYSETHSTGTNDHGLINVVIGEGTTSDNLSAVDWSSGPYFVEIQVDGTVMGTTQLLSVPYALHAETVTSYTETDPVYSSSEATNITATDITNLGNLSGTNTGDQDISGIATNEQAIQDTASQIRADIPTVTTYSVGDFAQGGIVFWVDETGQHGLVCAKEDQDGGSGIQWYNGSDTDTEAHGDGVYAGEMNTMLIIANQGSNSNDYAAGVCANYTFTESGLGGLTYGDWYLPSKEELNLMFRNKATIEATAGANGGSGFASTYYWSSTEDDNDSAKVIYFDNGLGYSHSKHYSTTRVRAVRAF